MPENLRKVLSLLSANERRKGVLVLLLMIAVALVETLGVASILPFIGVLSRPELVHTNEWLNWLYSGLGFESDRRFLFFLGTAFFIIVVSSIGMKILFKWAMTRLSEVIGYSLARRLVAGYLRQPYEWFLNQHSSNIGKIVLSEVEAVLNGAIKPMMEIFSKALIALLIVILLIVVDPMLAGIAGLGLIVAYLLAYVVVRGPLRTDWSIGVWMQTSRRFRAITGNLRRFQGTQGSWSGRAFPCSISSTRPVNSQPCAPRSAILAGVPPLIIEAFLMGGDRAFRAVHAGRGRQPEGHVARPGPVRLRRASNEAGAAGLIHELWKIAIFRPDARSDPRNPDDAHTGIRQSPGDETGRPAAG